MAIQITFEHKDPALRAPALRKEAKAVLKAAGRPRAELSLVIVDDAAMRVLNRDWRKIDRTTDVLSFPAGLELPEGVEPGEAGLPDVLGDVVISAPTAHRQASRYKRTFDLEIRRLLVHGVLHLMGHDHKKKAEAEVMRAEERRMLAELRKQDPEPAAR